MMLLDFNQAVPNNIHCASKRKHPWNSKGMQRNAATEDTSKSTKAVMYESSGQHELIGYQPPNNGLSYWSNCAQFAKQGGLMSCPATAFTVQNDQE